VALAAELPAALPVKATPPAPPPPSWWSGFVELDGESFLITPSGGALIPHGSASFSAGLALSLYKNPTGIINDFSVGLFLDTDWSGHFSGYWAGGGPSANGALFQTVLGLNQSVTFEKYWTLGNTFYNVISNDSQTKPAFAGCVGAACAALTNFSGYPALVWDELKLTLNDSFTGWPITFNPYVTWYYEMQSINIHGISAACVGACAVNDYQFFLGMTPTIDLHKYWGIPVTLKAPTYVTVGPSSFWNAAPELVGPSSGSLGVFTTGLTAIVPLSFMAPQFGHWFAKVGFQWYDVINTAMQNGNAFSVVSTSLPPGHQCAATSSSNCSSIFIGYGGVGVAF
jgi:hypothetical protein